MIETLNMLTRKELNAQYRAIPLDDKVHITLRKYCNAMANLYGIISVQKAYEIIASQCRDMVSKDQFLSFCEVARHEREEYVILSDYELGKGIPDTDPWDRKIMDRWLSRDSITIYNKLLHGHFGKPYYIPAKTKLLAYADPRYYEACPEAAAILTFLQNRCNLSSAAALDAFDEILFAVRCLGAPVADVIRRLREIGAVFFNNSEIQTFMMYYRKFARVMRTQYNRGWTMEEIEANPDVKKYSSTDKIGRNDPCPCGSGKKYKHCCGR